MTDFDEDLVREVAQEEAQKKDANLKILRERLAEKKRQKEAEAEARKGEKFTSEEAAKGAFATFGAMMIFDAALAQLSGMLHREPPPDQWFDAAANNWVQEPGGLFDFRGNLL